MGRHSRQKININLSPTLNFSPFCDACPPNCPSSPSSCTDRLCLSLLTAAKGQRSQPVTDSLSTWQSRQIQLEWNYCLHCSVCNRTSVARFPIDTSSCSPSLWQLSQLQTSIPHDILWKNKKKVLLCWSSFPPLSPSLSLPLPPSTHPLRRTRAAFVSAGAQCTGAGCSVWVDCWPDTQWVHTAVFPTGSVTLNPSPLTGY